jgi:hypothetical protein
MATDRTTSKPGGTGRFDALDVEAWRREGVATRAG